MARWRPGAPLAGVYPRLYADLAEAPERLARFLPHAPADPRAWEARALQLDALWRDAEAVQRRRAVADALAGAHERLGVTPAQARHIERLRRGDAVVVVTGQQPGLLGGPLFTVYKALGAIALASRAEAALGRPVVPVFWVASEDHDFSEVSRLRLAAADGSLVQLALSGSGDFRSAGSIPVPAEAHHLVGQVEGLFPPTAAGRPFAEALRASLRGPGRMSLAEWFVRQLHALLGARGLLFYDPMLPALRSAAGPVFAAAPARAARANRALAEAAERLAAAGYAPGLHLDADHAHLFVYHGGRRLALHLSDGRLRTRDGEVDLSAAELAARAIADPSQFSPNVALRPVVQDFTLPVLAQLGGPGEVAYLAQLGGVFDLWDRPMPAVGPRPGATLVLPEDAEALARCGDPPLPALRADVTAVLEEYVARNSSLDVDALFAAEREAVAARYARLEGLLGGISPHLPRIARGNAERVLHQVAYLERKAHQHRRRAHRDVALALRRAAGRLFPGGALQERASCAYPYLFRWGVAFLDALAEAFSEPSLYGRHEVLHWEPEAGA